MEWFDKVADFFNVDRFLDVIRDNEEFIMTRGLRIIALGCIVIAIAYGVVAYIQFSRF